MIERKQYCMNFPLFFKSINVYLKCDITNFMILEEKPQESWNQGKSLNKCKIMANYFDVILETIWSLREQCLTQQTKLIFLNIYLNAESYLRRPYRSCGFHMSKSPDKLTNMVYKHRKTQMIKKKRQTIKKYCQYKPSSKKVGRLCKIKTKTNSTICISYKYKRTQTCWN